MDYLPTFQMFTHPSSTILRDSFYIVIFFIIISFLY